MTHALTGAALAVAIAALSACTPAGTLIGGGAVLTRAVLEERTTLTALDDVTVEAGVNTRLGNHSGELFRDVSVDVHEGRVLLAGSVPRPALKVAATESAWATPGVASVTDEITIARDTGTGAYLRDVRIANQLRYELLTETDVRSINYTVTVIDRVVHLTGIARSPAELARVVALARSVAGVTGVVSHVLAIDDPRRVRRAAQTPQESAGG